MDNIWAYKNEDRQSKVCRRKKLIYNSVAVNQKKGEAVKYVDVSINISSGNDGSSRARCFKTINRKYYMIKKLSKIKKKEIVIKNL